MFIELFTVPYDTVGRDHRARRNQRTTVRSRRGRIHPARSTTPNSTIHRSYGTNLQLCSTAWGLTFLCRQESQQSPPKKATGGGAEAVPILAFCLVPALPGTEAALPQPPPGPLRVNAILHKSNDHQFIKFLFDRQNNPNPCRRHTSVFSP